VARIPLTDEETAVIFPEEVKEQLSAIDGSKQQDVLGELLDVVGADVPPDAKAYEKIENVTIYRAGGKTRIYSAVVTNVPAENPEYHVVFVLHLDPTHEYDDNDLVAVDETAQRRIDEVGSFRSVERMDEFLEAKNVLWEDDLVRFLGRNTNDGQ
jgi:hypothetical protein